MGQRLRTHLDLLHPDISRKVIEKQDKLAKVTKRCRKFVVGNCLYARNFRGNNKWIPVIVTCILGPVSYQVQTSGSLNTVMLINLDIVTPLTVMVKSQMILMIVMIGLFCALHQILNQLQVQNKVIVGWKLHHLPPSLFGVLIETEKLSIVMDLTFQLKKGGML